jgi:glycosyltransferase involved in cell wall biosynthesis
MMPRPSLLAVTSELPWPLSSGGHLRTYHLLVSLARRFDVRLVVPSRPEEAEGRAALARGGLVVRAVETGPRHALGEACRIAGAAVRRDPYVLYARHRRRSVLDAVRREARLTPPQVVYLDHLDSLLYAGAAGRAPVVIDMHNVYSTLAERAAREASGYARRRYLAGEAGLLQRKEVAATRLAHTIFACSEEEASFFRNLGARSVAVVPNGVDTLSYPWPPPRLAGDIDPYPPAPPTVLFVGALEWQPNVSAVGFLAREVMPAVRARVPKARLLIVGRRPCADVLALADGPRVEIAADVPDVRPYWLRADVLAVPLETGGGTRIKILEAFAAGVPVVSSPVGCEGIAARDGEHLLVAGRDTFAAAVAAALIDRDAADARARAARALAEREYDWWAIGRRAAGRVMSAAGYGPRGVVRPVAAHEREEASA